MANITKNCKDCGTTAVTTNEDLIKSAINGCGCGEKFTFSGFETTQKRPGR